MAEVLSAKGPNMEALSPRDVNAQKPPKTNDIKVKAMTQAATQAKAPPKDKEHPPPPPAQVIEPPSSDRKDGATYQVGKLLGKGGFAICHEGTLLPARKKFALKIVRSKMPPKMEQKVRTA